MKRLIICSAAVLVCALVAAPVAAADIPDEMDMKNRPNLCCYPHRFFALPLRPASTTQTTRDGDNHGLAVSRIGRRIAQGPPGPVVVLPWIFDFQSIGVSALGRF